MEMNNLRTYTPSDPTVAGIVYLQDDKGRDWYESQKLFSADTLKIMWSPDGIIRCADMDVSMLYPDGCSVAEIDVNAVPDGFDYLTGKYQFDGERVTKIAPDFSGNSRHLWEKRMRFSMVYIAKYEAIERQRPLTDADTADYLRWNNYLDALALIDPNDAPDINWPEPPAI